MVLIYKKVFNYALNGGELVLLSDSDPNTYTWCNQQINKYNRGEFSKM